MTNNGPKDKQPDGLSASNVSVLDMCSCERAPKRKGQRNCHLCNREANRKYQAKKKREIGVLRTIVDAIKAI